MTRRLALALLVAALPLGACSDDGGDDEVVFSDPPRAELAEYEGTITEVIGSEPIEGDCVPADDLDPDGSVSSDDPPICTDPATAPLGSILVADDEGGQVVFTIRVDTSLADVRTTGDEIGFDDLAAGQRVRIGFDGQIAESFPGQASADFVEVTS